MCGFVALVDHKHSICPSIITKLSSVLTHRGPCAHHYFYQKNILLWHNLLAIESTVDDGKQPFISQDGQLYAVVNGELYPHAHIRKKMMKLGYSFKTNSDSELVLVLYQHYGIAFVEYLRGEFSFVIWDKKHDQIIAVRDRFGIKPLVYGIQNQRLYIGSEAKALFAAGFEASWNSSGLMQSFTHQYLFPGMSLFNGLKQLPPGHLIVYKNDSITIKKYWEMNVCQQKNNHSDILEQLTNAVQMRIPSSKPVAFSLSGGLDSSAVVKIASQFIDHKIDCYSVSFEGYGYDEYLQAKRFADESGFNIHRVNISNHDLISYIEQAAYYSEGLAINGQYVGKYLLNKAIHDDGYSVVMSGEGADEAFMGYAHIHYDYLLHETKDFQTLDLLKQQYPLQLNLMLPKDKNLSKIPSFLLAKIAFCRQLQPLFNQNFIEQLNDYQLNVYQSELALLTKKGLTASQTANQLWVQLALANNILKTLGDGMEMAFSIEGRLPFLDHLLFDSATGLSTDKKLDGITSKAKLRQVLSHILPEYISQRKKHPFIAPPLALGLNQTSRELIWQRIEGLKDDCVFDYNKVTKWLTKWMNGNIDWQKSNDPVLMMLLSFSALKKNFNLNTLG
ncbi:asparagine synthase (glutamine-hydrolyzing) [Aliikangiella sp. IMCC44359]|uniref:asparagine synthase (glutamine-hydrolyzing) n=1 Tax=Aliikangiella sp. IMCC44359 TaxID=3459125 RepID=UPI00403AA250